MPEWLGQFDLFTLTVLALIVWARIADVSIGIVRTILVVRGYRWQAAVLGFVEVIIWVVAVSGVLQDITVPKIIAYGLGFALGNYVGMIIEDLMALGTQMVTFISTKRMNSVAFSLRLNGFACTEVPAFGRDGAVAMCQVVCQRRNTPKVIRMARQVDQDVFAVINDVRGAAAEKHTRGFFKQSRWTGWVLKQK